ncbi:C-type lectin receptor-like tyrosine-protein kinase At1g52310 isoform X2 [Hordeum vulgare subsp. vulgare]|uniref:C-type lectin receptor-like tyrosine-protein kinase At1g52310 isoform X2 n=1 Tax=Hordeum vulgare subsp. vulgare TaxID=112509 RepID=UPI001D1A4B92|nr:C-type lectin receptor-like tyrosine-protein kinase At1g52310 isoform X2 [Hordeum vulgare subsp. vulgare]
MAMPLTVAVAVALAALLLSAAAAPALAHTSSCPDGWQIGPDRLKCFMHISSSLSWDGSEALCRNFSAHLAALSSVQELNFARSLCGAASSGCWVGGRRRNTSSGVVGWKWSDNSSSWNETAFPGEPLHPNCTGARCGLATSDDMCTLVTSKHTALTGKKCAESHGLICMMNHDRCYHDHCHKEYFIVLIVVSGLILSTTLAVVVWLLVYKRSKKRKRSREASGTSATALVPPLWKVFNSEELRSITKNFSEGNRLPGNAKTGGTYSGTLPDGSKLAIKRLKRSSLQRKKDFYSEISRVAKLYHPNLVAVKGCCYDHGDRFIVYEFVANGPLDVWLHHIPRGGRSLDWATRMRVATTLAQGIAFLHDKVKPQVVHRDIRASNVLLDEEFGSHLMGVGLSKFVPWEVMHERTVKAATYGYLAPEFIYRNELTTKSDVYSFGVLLLEIISGRRPAQSVESAGWQTIFEWATPLVQSHRHLELLDPLINDLPEIGVIQKVVDLVYACTQHVPSVRPRMSHVVHQLQQLELKSAASEQLRSGTSTSATSPMLPLEVRTPR